MLKNLRQRHHRGTGEFSEQVSIIGRKVCSGQWNKVRLRPEETSGKKSQSEACQDTGSLHRPGEGKV